jgi:hypothetical protein
MKDSKQRLFEVMQRVDPNFKPKMVEITPKMAGVAINRNLGGDLRTKRISKDAITSLFSKYIGKSIPFYLKVSDTDKPTKYELVEVTFNRDPSMRTDYSSLDEGGDYVLKLYFYNDAGTDDDAPYAENKKNIVLSYVLINDKYDSPERSFYYNQFAINLLLYAANVIRKAYFSAFPIRTELGDGSYGINTSVTEEKMKSNLTKQSFRQFPFSSSDMENRSNIKPEPTEDGYF